MSEPVKDSAVHIFIHDFVTLFEGESCVVFPESVAQNPGTNVTFHNLGDCNAYLDFEDNSPFQSGVTELKLAPHSTHSETLKDQQSDAGGYPYTVECGKDDDAKSGTAYTTAAYSRPIIIIYK